MINKKRMSGYIAIRVPVELSDEIKRLDLNVSSMLRDYLESIIRFENDE